MHTRIESCGNLLMSGCPVYTLRQRLQRGDGDNRNIESEADPLGHGGGNAHTCKGARTAPEGDGIQLRFADAALRHQSVDHRQQQFTVAPRLFTIPLHDTVIAPDCSGTGNFGGFNRQQMHEYAR